METRVIVKTFDRISNSNSQVEREENVHDKWSNAMTHLWMSENWCAEDYLQSLAQCQHFSLYRGWEKQIFNLLYWLLCFVQYFRGGLDFCVSWMAQDTRIRICLRNISLLSLCMEGVQRKWYGLMKIIRRMQRVFLFLNVNINCPNCADYADYSKTTICGD